MLEAEPQRGGPGQEKGIDDAADGAWYDATLRSTDDFIATATLMQPHTHRPLAVGGYRSGPGFDLEVPGPDWVGTCPTRIRPDPELGPVRSG